MNIMKDLLQKSFMTCYAVGESIQREIANSTELVLKKS